MKVGDSVKIVADPFFPVLNGLIGTILDIENGLYRISATNYGRPMKNKSGDDKRVFAWSPGTWRRVPIEALDFISPSP